MERRKEARARRVEVEQRPNKVNQPACSYSYVVAADADLIFLNEATADKMSSAVSSPKKLAG